MLPNVLPIQVSGALADEYASKVDAILRAIRERFHDDEILGGASAQPDVR
jgi:hypothetical protein